MIQNRLRAALLGFLVSACASLSSAWAAGEGELQALMQRLAGIKSVHAHFRESKHLSILDKPIILTGILRYEAPDYVKKQTLLPHAEVVEVRAQKLVIENPGQGKTELLLDDYPAIGAFVESFRSTLAGDLEQLQRFYDVALERTGGQWQMRLKPKQAQMRQYIDSIVIRGHDAEVTEVETLEAGGDRSIMQISPRSE